MIATALVRNAFLAGTAIALACGVVGYFVVLRAQVFAGDALSHLGFTGATAAAAAGVDLRLGLFAATIGGGVALAGIGRRGRPDDAATGIAFAWFLGLGVFLLSLSGAADGQLGARTLFGSIFGLGGFDTGVAALVATAVVGASLVLARPLLFATVDPEVAAARGVPVRALGLALLVLLGVTAAEATTAVGALLWLGLLCAPAAAAQRLSARPYRALALSAALAVACTWVGLAVSYALPAVPPSTAVIVSAATVLGAAMLLGPRRSAPRLDG